MKFRKPDAFCDVYGRTLNNLVWGYFLENRSLGVAIGDMAKEIGISRPKAYQIIEDFMKKGYVYKDRIVSKTQLYKLNKDNAIVKIFIRNFNECLDMVVTQYSTKNKSISSDSRVSVSAKSF